MKLKFSSMRSRASSGKDGSHIEMIWQGRVHMGDEPGSYGDSSYSGLSWQLPFMILRSNEPGSDVVQIVVEAEDVRTFASYPGHLVAVYLHISSDPSNPMAAWSAVEVGRGRFQNADTSVPISIDLGSYSNDVFFVSVLVQCDLSVPPGLFDEFVVRRVSLSTTEFRYFASLGFSDNSV